jgi:hypothetical protein
MIKFVTDIKPRLKHFSTVALGLGAALMGLHTMYPSLVVTAIGADGVTWYMRFVLAILLWGLVGKFVVQDAEGPKA